MADPLGGPIGVPLLGPVGALARPTDTLAPIRDMMARMALVAVAGPGIAKGDHGPDPVVREAVPRPLVMPGVPLGLAAAEEVVLGRAAKLNFALSEALTEQTNASLQLTSRGNGIHGNLAHGSFQNLDTQLSLPITAPPIQLHPPQPIVLHEVDASHELDSTPEYDPSRVMKRVIAFRPAAEGGTPRVNFAAIPAPGSYLLAGGPVQAFLPRTGPCDQPLVKLGPFYWARILDATKGESVRAVGYLYCTGICCWLVFENVPNRTAPVVIGLTKIKAVGRGGRVHIRLVEPTPGNVEVGEWIRRRGDIARAWRTSGIFIVIDVPDCTDFKAVQIYATSTTYEFADGFKDTMTAQPKVDSSTGKVYPMADTPGVMIDAPNPPPEFFYNSKMIVHHNGSQLVKATFVWGFYTFICCDGELLGFADWVVTTTITYNADGTPNPASTKVSDPEFRGPNQLGPIEHGAAESAGLDLDSICDNL